MAYGKNAMRLSYNDTFYALSSLIYKNVEAMGISLDEKVLSVDDMPEGSYFSIEMVKQNDGAYAYIKLGNPSNEPSLPGRLRAVTEIDLCYDGFINIYNAFASKRNHFRDVL